jgi:hypothetical protein
MKPRPMVAIPLLAALSLHFPGCEDSRVCTTQFVPAIEARIDCATFSAIQVLTLRYRLAGDGDWSACSRVGSDSCQAAAASETWHCGARTSASEANYNVALTVDGTDFGEPLLVTVEHDGCHPITKAVALPTTGT